MNAARAARGLEPQTEAEFVVGDGSFLVEDFINAITSQLDRVQDALRLKAVNRPLTYALKDLSLDLQVFVELDGQGNVRFRTSGPNETGSSTVRLSFTTITKPMIEENTISLAMTRSPSLSEIGLDEAERQRLEQIGVRNAAQLERLGQSTGARAVSRWSGISAERLRQAVTQSRPRLTDIKPAPPSAPPPVKTPPPLVKPPVTIVPPGKTPPPVKRTPPILVKPPRPDPFPPPHDAPPVVRPGKTLVAPISKNAIQVAPNTRRLQLLGANLIGEAGAPQVFFNKQELGLAEADDDRPVIELPEDLSSGALEIALPDGQQLTYELSVANGTDPWEPQ
jgi:hypothetical protein